MVSNNNLAKLERFAGTLGAQAHTVQQYLFAALLLITVLCIHVPFSPAMPWETLDPSWIYGMNQALAQGLVFGKDIIFTFGPYASVYTTTYHPATDHLMIAGSVYLAASFFLVAYLNFRKSYWLLQLALLFVLAALMYSRDALFFFYPLLVGVYIYKAASTGSLNALTVPQAALLLVALFSPFGLFPLIKGSMLIACVAIIVFSGFFLIKTGKLTYAILAAAVPVVTVAAFWLLAQQPLSALPPYFISMLPIVSGYTEAMATFGKTKELLLYLVAVFFLGWVVFRNALGTKADNTVLSLMMLCLLFLAFKAGFVRHDGHALISSTMLLMVAVLAATLLAPSRTVVMFILVLASWAYTDAIHVKTSTESFYNNFKTTFSNAKNGLKQRFSNPEKLRQGFDQRVTVLKDRGGIPLLNGTVDIYSHDQSHLIASGNNWNPRPILQSYSVYTPKLAEKNKAHLLEPGRPDNIIFKAQPIDNRLPSLEDGASWPVLLSNYEPSTIKNGYLYLKHKADAGKAQTETLRVSKSTYVMGEQIELPESDAVIFAKLHIKKSLLGTLANTLFKPSSLEITLTLQDETSRTYRMIAPMAQAGFILSPLIENTEDFGLLYSGLRYLNDKAVKSITVRPIGYSPLWNNTIEIELATITYDTKPNVVDLYDFKQPVHGDDLPEPTMVNRCYGYIDALNEASPTPASVNTSFLLTANGWLALSTESGELPDKTYLVLTAPDENRLFIEAARTQRPDVGAHFHKPQLSASGFSATSNVSALNGNYTLSLAYSLGGSLFLCPEFNIPTSINSQEAQRRPLP